MPVHDDLGVRMKTFYEQIPKTKLMRRCPVALRIDGKSFHTFTRGFQKPFDEVLIKSMQETMKYLCENIQGCVLGYTQSDEITLILVDYKKLTSSAWFDYEVQKICSIAASIATMAFNKAFRKNVNDWWFTPFSGVIKEFQERETLYKTYKNAIEKGAMFDCRCFNIPKEEVTNLVYWRQLDATRNSIQMVGQVNFSHKELQNKSCNEIQDMLMTQKGVNWNDLPIYQKRGSCCVKENHFIENEKGTQICFSEGCSDPFEDEETLTGVYRSGWVIDTEIPIFKNEGREYIDRLVYVGEE
jgi:tRNA(His) 5'-end guanylyltransferase